MVRKLLVPIVVAGLGLVLVSAPAATAAPTGGTVSPASRTWG